MHILLVSAYPESASFGGQLVSQLRQHLRARGDVVAVSDLHRMNFPAIARKRQFAADAFFDLQAAQARATADRTLPRAVQAEQDKVRTADMIVFLAPVYWASPPAIMRGWLEQVLTPGFAYDRDRAFDGGLLAGKSAFFVTTHAGKLGAATVAGAQARMQDLLAPLEDRPLHYSGIRTLPALALSPPDYKDISARVQALDTALQAVVAKIDTPLPEMRTVHPLINLNGRPGVGKKTVAHLLAGYIGATVV
ncbi:MAG: NAD(P)H-dependent oxidoreductase, partial [Alphaproteobacteria bacterium]|nr:NAD(P)H-dependent oxidoreductase [Alphaproteobacteria bacterium]